MPLEPEPLSTLEGSGGKTTADSFAADGEMGGRIRVFDWSKTPLGARDSWSPSLKMMIRFLLANRFPMLLWWGPQFIQIYNDPYRPVLGTKHPTPGLGHPVSECWSEIWHVLRPLIETPFNGGPATWMEDIQLEIKRHGFMEETHFTIAYSPVPDETVPSGIGGVLATVHEITQKVVGERRVVALRDLGARLAEVKSTEEACAIVAKTLAAHDKDVPFVLMYLIDADGKRTQLRGISGSPISEDFAPRFIELEGAEKPVWPFAEALRSGSMQIVKNLRAHFRAIPHGPWSDVPDTAVVIPITSTKRGDSVALMVVGVSARLKFDEFYREFFELIRTRVTSTFASAQAYEEERKRAEALAEIDRAKTAFFSNVSHEFRTPLTLLLGPAEDLLANQHGALPPQATEQIEVIRRNAHRLQRLVNTLLDFSRIEAGRVQASFVETDLSALTADLASVFRSTMERAGLEFEVNMPTQPLRVFVDQEMWEKIVFNLLSNAFKFTLSGTVQVTLDTKDREAALAIRDTGIGIAPEDLPNVFKRFHRVEGRRGRTHEGTGIGLALVQELVKLHGGTISVRSEVGHGTTFKVRLPFGKEHLPTDRVQRAPVRQHITPHGEAFVEEALTWLPEALPARPITEKTASGQKLHARPRIVLAEDNADMRFYVHRLLQPDYAVEAVADGAAALESARRNPPDLILSDVMMPHMNGFELVRSVRANKKLSFIPVILLSARAGEEAQLENASQLADDYLTKPFSARELLARVGVHIRLAQARADRDAELRKSERRLHESEVRYQSLFDSIDEGFCVIEMLFGQHQKAIDYRFVEVNPAFEQQAGIHGAAGKRMLEFVSSIEPHWLENYGRVALTGEPIRFAAEYKSLHRWFDVYAFRVGDPREHKVAVIFNNITEKTLAEAAQAATAIDNARLYEDAQREIAERKRVAEELQKAKEELGHHAEELEQQVAVRTASLREALGQLEEFSYSVSHDLRAPLRAIEGYARVFREDFGGALPPGADVYLDKISRSAERMERLINEVLTLSRVARADLRLRPVKLQQFITDLVEQQFSTQPPTADITIVTPHTVMGDEARLGQAISNLINNAVKFVLPGERPIVCVRSELSGNRVRIWIEDQGIGIPVQHRGKLFVMFQRLPANRPYEGTGIGLAIVRKAVEVMGGSVGVESNEPKGSRFWIELGKDQT